MSVVRQYQQLATALPLSAFPSTTDVSRDEGWVSLVPIGDPCKKIFSLFDHFICAGEQRRLDAEAERSANGSLRAARGEPVILVLNQYKCSGCNPGKCPDTRRMVFASRTGSRDIACDSYLCIAVWRSEPPRR